MGIYFDAATPFEKSNRVEHLLSHTRAVQQFFTMREIVHLQAGQCGNQIGAKVSQILGDGKLKINSIADFTKISHDTLSLKRTEVNIFD